MSASSEEDPFFRSLSALKDLLFNSSSTTEATTTGPEPPTAPEAGDDNHRVNAAKNEQLLERITHLESQLQEATQIAEKEKKLRLSLNQAFGQLTDHNTQVTEQLALTETSKEPLQREIEQLKESIRKQEDDARSKQEAWDLERKVLEDAREAALQKCDSWQARFASEERHVKELEEKCKAVKQEYEASHKSAEEASQSHKQATKELEGKLMQVQGERNGLVDDMSKLKSEAERTAGILKDLMQWLIMNNDQDSLGEAGTADRSMEAVEAELNATDELLVSIGNLVDICQAFADGKSDATEDDMKAAKEKTRECKKRLQSIRNGSKKRALPAGEATEEPDSKRATIDSEMHQEADI